MSTCFKIEHFLRLFGRVTQNQCKWSDGSVSGDVFVECLPQVGRHGVGGVKGRIFLKACAEIWERMQQEKIVCAMTEVGANG